MKQRKLKKIWLIIPVILVLLLTYPTVLTVQIISKDYNFTSVFKIITTGIKSKVLENDYSKTLEVAVSDSDFKKENVDSYFKITYHDKKDFINSINKLLKIGYTTEDINNINDKLSDDMVKSLYDYKLIKDISEYLKFDYFKSENLYRYIDYDCNDYQKTIVYVNIGLDQEFYTDAKIITELNENVLVNKYNKLDETYIPNNLVQIENRFTKGNDKQYLDKTASLAFQEMCEAALLDGMHILANSAYRSYEKQQDIYDKYLNLYGQSYVDNYVAFPGFSEHQTGLALDVAAEGYSVFKNSNEYTWMLDNSYKYGFILRYTKENQHITGYQYESWHFRYVGLEAAKYIKENNITYEEYYAIFLDK